MSSEVEPELAFFQEQREVILWNPIVFAQHPLGLIPKVLDAIDVIAALGELCRVIDPNVVELAHIQRIVAAETVGVDHTVRRHFPLDYRHQRGGTGIVDYLGIHLAAALEQAEHNNLAGRSATTLALADAAEVALVQLHRAIEDFMLDHGQLLDNELSQLAIVERGRIGLDAQHAGRRTRRNFEHEKLDQPGLLFPA